MSDFCIDPHLNSPEIFPADDHGDGFSYLVSYFLNLVEDSDESNSKFVDCTTSAESPHCPITDSETLKVVGVTSSKRSVGGSKKKKSDMGFKVAFRTMSEIEIMDDGYKWRKYGKKSVKNSPNPRNYYRCSQGECNVKKQVERDREDSRFVITTYEGKHNHESPCVVYCITPQDNSKVGGGGINSNQTHFMNQGAGLSMKPLHLPA